MRIYESDSAMSQQMEELFHLTEIINKLNQYPDEDRNILANRIIYSILIGTEKNIFVSLAQLEVIRYDIMKTLLRSNVNP